LSLTKCTGNGHTRSINSSVIIRVLRRLAYLNHLRLYETKLKSVKFFEILASQKFINLRIKSMTEILRIVKTGNIVYNIKLNFRAKV